EHGNWCSPVALTRDTPILEPVSHSLLAESVLLGVGSHFLNGLLVGETIELARIDEQTFHCRVRKHRGFLLVRSGRFSTAPRKNHDADFDSVLMRKLVIAFIMRRHRHDGASAIVHQNVIRYPDRDFFLIERIDGVAVGKDTVL